MQPNEKGGKSIGDKSLLTIDWKLVENFLGFMIDSVDWIVTWVHADCKNDQLLRW